MYRTASFVWDVNDAANLSFVTQQTSHIESEVYRTQYPDITYTQMMPVDYSAAEWATSVTYFSLDQVGEAKWINGHGTDMPYANVLRNKDETTVYMAGMGYGFSLEEINQAQMLGMNLDSEGAGSADRGYEEFCEKIAYEGDAEKNFNGMFAYPGITVVPMPNGGGGSPLWTSKTADEILDDINTILAGVWTNSRQIEMADTIILPATHFALIAGKRIPGTAETVLAFIQRANIYTVKTGQPLKIMGDRRLETIAAGGTGRMVAYRRDPAILKLHIPMRHRFLPFQARDLFYHVPGMFRLGGLDIRRTGGFRYGDGI